MTPRVWTALIVLMIGLSWGTTAFAGDKQEAKRHFEAGLALHESEDFAGAVAEFEASVQLHPTKMGYFNLANCLKALHRYGEALEAIDRLEKDFPGKLEAKFKKAIGEFRTTVRAMVAEITASVTPSGAVLRLDGRELGNAPLAKPIIVGSGSHTLEVTAEGYAPESVSFSVLSGDNKTIEVNLVVESPVPGPVPALVAPASAAPSDSSLPAAQGQELAAITKKDDHRRLSGLFWTGVGLTVVSGVVAGIMYGMAGSQSREFGRLSNDYEGVTVQLADDPGSTVLQNEERDVWTKMENANDDTALYSGVGLGAAIATGVFAVSTAIVLVRDVKKSNAKFGEKKVAFSSTPWGLTVAF